MSIVDEAFKIATAGFLFTKNPTDRLRGAYVRRRGEYLHLQNSGWNASQLSAQLKAELAAIQDYILGKDSLIKGTETTLPSHLDLRIEAALTTLSVDGGAFGQRFFDGIQKESLANRANWVSQIVWRAVAIHSDVLWKSAGPPPLLQQAALDELLDRRLNAVELMSCNVNSSGFGLRGRPWEVQGPAGPWYDGFRVRSLEYPWVEPADSFNPILSQMAEWRLDASITSQGLVFEVVFDPPNHVHVRVGQTVAAAWRMDQGKVWINFHPMPSLAPADIILEMCYKPKPDFWDRSWMFCDHVSSLVQIAALWLGTCRRTSTSDLFNNVMNRPDYIRLGPVVGDQHDRGILMADVHDAYFENLDVDFDDLQVGDLVRFWNSRIYELLPPYSGAWGSEFSLIMGVDVDGPTGKIVKPIGKGPRIWLAGHGKDTMLYNGMATEAVEYLTSRFLRARLLLPSDPAVTSKTDEGQNYVRWDPYEKFDAPGAWWVEIPKTTWHDEWNYGTPDEVVKGMPRVIAPASGGDGYNPPPDPDAAYFPLFEPAVEQTDADGDSWRAYLRKRKADPHYRLSSTKLKDLAVDGRLAQGLFFRGAQTRLPVVRPRVRV